MSVGSLHQLLVKLRTKVTYQYLLAITLGITYGIALNALHAGHTVTTITTLPGPLFLRALQCAVLPMMFFNITVSVTKIYSDGKTSTLGKRFAALCLTTSLLAVINGVCVANIFGALFTSHTVDDDDEEGAEVELKCPDGMGKVTVDSSGRLICLQDYQLESLNIPDSQQTLELLDKDNLLVNDALIDQTLLEQVVGTFKSIFPKNAVESFSVPNVISVITIALMVGGAIVYLNDWKDNQMSDDDEMLCPLDLGDIEMKPPSKKKRSKASGGDAVKVNTMLIDNSIPAPPIATPPRSRTAFSKSKNTSEYDELPTAQVLLQFCMEMSNLSNTVVGWIVSAAPLCMGFLIARSLGDAGSLVDLMQNVGVYVAACLTGMLIHVTVVLPALLHYFTGLNPYTHIFSCRKAILVAFSTASSIATLPMTIQCCVQTNCVSPVIANVVLPMGTNLVKDGLAVGLSCAVMFLAHSDNLSSKLSVIVWFSMSVSAFLGAIGTAPIQSAGLVTVITVWEAGFPNHDVPSAISYLQAIDFITDRFVTTTGVISNIVITTILQFMIDKERCRNEAKTRGSVS